MQSSSGDGVVSGDGGGSVGAPRPVRVIMAEVAQLQQRFASRLRRPSPGLGLYAPAEPGRRPGVVLERRGSEMATERDDER